MTDKEFKAKLKSRQEYYTDVKNRLLLKIDELKEAINNDYLLKDVETEIDKFDSLIYAWANTQQTINFMKIMGNEDDQGEEIEECNRKLHN